LAWDETSRLGEQILRELSGEDTTDTLLRWMAHRVAEVMTEAECATDPSERAGHQKQAEDLILRIWGKRTSWPHGWPPPTAEMVFRDRAATKRRARMPRPMPNEGDVNAILESLHELQEDEYVVYLQRALATRSVEAEEQWLAAACSELSDQERDGLQKLVETAKAIQSGSFFIPFDEDGHETAGPEDRVAERLDAALDRIDERRAQLRLALVRAGDQEEHGSGS
jgi:hypothetical protein